MKKIVTSSLFMFVGTIYLFLALSSCNNNSERKKTIVNAWKGQEIQITDFNEVIRNLKDHGIPDKMLNLPLETFKTKLNESIKSIVYSFDQNGEFHGEGQTGFYKFSDDYEQIYITPSNGQKTEILTIIVLTKDKLILMNHGTITTYMALK